MDKINQAGLVQGGTTVSVMEDTKLEKWTVGSDGLLIKASEQQNKRQSTPVALLPDSNIYVDVDQEWRLIRETGDDLLIDGAAEKTGLAVIDLTTSDIPNEPWVIASESGEFIPAVAVSELVPGTTHGEGIESQSLEESNRVSTSENLSRTLQRFGHIKEEQHNLVETVPTWEVESWVDDSNISPANTTDNQDLNGEGEEGSSVSSDEEVADTEDETEEEERIQSLGISTGNGLFMECDDAEQQGLVKVEGERRKRGRPPKERGAASKTREKKKKKVKRNYCLFCSKSFTKLRPHLEMVHANEVEVVLAISLPLYSTARKAKWQELMNKGNYAHNMEVLKTGEGRIIPRRMSQAPLGGFEPCKGCHAFLSKSNMARHFYKCPANMMEDGEAREVKEESKPSDEASTCGVQEGWEGNGTGPRMSTRIQLKKQMAEYGQQVIKEAAEQLPVLLECVDEEDDDLTFQDDSADEDYNPPGEDTSHMVNSDECLEDNTDECNSAAVSDEDSTNPEGIRVMKTTGKNRWSKRHSCVFCKRMINKLPPHFEKCHRDEEDIAIALRLEKNSQERKVKLMELLRKGDYAHNKEVLRSGRGTLIPIRRQSNERTVESFFPCEACQMLVHKSHIYKCPMRKKMPKTTEAEISQCENLVTASTTEGKYHKRHSCIFCQRLCLSISKHIADKHANEPKVVTALSFPKGSAERRVLLREILLEGDNVHNLKVLESKRGKLIPQRRSANSVPPEDFIACTKCQSFVRKKSMERHKRLLHKDNAQKQDEVKGETGQGLLKRNRGSVGDRIQRKYKRMSRSGVREKNRRTRKRPKVLRQYYRPLCDRCGSYCAPGTCSLIQDSTSKDPGKIQVMTSSRGKKRCRMHCCPYCRRMVTKLPYHLERWHKNEPDVLKAVGLPKFSAERKGMWQKLMRKGNYWHNTEVLRTGKGVVIPQRRPSEATTADKFVPCLGCGAFMKKTAVAKHRQYCPAAEAIPMTKGRGNIWKPQVHTCAHLPISANAGGAIKAVLDSMQSSELNMLIRTDDLIVRYGEEELQSASASTHHSHIRSRLRLLGRFLLEARKQAQEIQTLTDCIDQKYFSEVIDVTKTLANYSPETNKYGIPSIPLKIGTALRRCAVHVVDQAKEMKDESLKKKASHFLSMCQTDWAIEVSSAALECTRQHLKETKQKETTHSIRISQTSDIKTVCLHLQNKATRLVESLHALNSIETWRDLAEITAVQIILFNRQRDVCLSSLEQWQYHECTRSQGAISSGSDKHLLEIEKALSTKLKVLDCSGVHPNDPVKPVLLALCHQSQIELLLQTKGTVGIPQESRTIFTGLPLTVKPIDTSETLSRVCNEAGVKDAETVLASTMRKHVALVSQLLSLNEEELGVVVTVLGHNLSDVKNFLKVHTDTLYLAKVSKALLGLENGQRDDYFGKSLDEITLDEHEEVDNVGATKPSTGTPDEGMADEVIGRRRRFTVKTPWTWAEKMAVQRQFKSFLKSKTLPGREDCLDAQDQEPLLAKRPWSQVKYCVKNMMGTKNNLSEDEDSDETPEVSERDEDHEDAGPTKRFRPITGSPQKVSRRSASTRCSRSTGKRRESGRKQWTAEEKDAIKRQLGWYLKKGIVPGKDDCLMAKDEEPILALRPWDQIKYCVKNMLTSKSLDIERKGIPVSNIKKDVQTKSRSTPSKDKVSARYRQKKRRESGRTPWSQEEKDAIRRQLGKHLKNRTVPGKDDCLHAKGEEPILALRPWDQIKYCIKNMLASPKALKW